MNARAACAPTFLLALSLFSGSVGAAPVYFINGTFLCPYYLRDDGEWDTSPDLTAPWGRRAAVAATLVLTAGIVLLFLRRRAPSILW